MAERLAGCAGRFRFARWAGLLMLSISAFGASTSISLAADRATPPPAGETAFEQRAARSGRGSVRRIVVLREQVADPERAARELARHCGGRRGHVYTRALRGFALELPSSELARLVHDPRVRYVSEDRVFLADGQPLDFAQRLPVGISRIDGELNATASIDGTPGAVDADLAVLDTGVSTTHPDLEVFRSVSLVSGTSVDDLFGHGTHVAGIAAARDDDSGVVGVAPGARIWSVKVLNDFGFGLSSDIIAGVDWVTAHADEIDVANMSLGGTGFVDDQDCGRTNGDALHEAICNSVAAGVVYVVAAGNNGSNAASKIPASYDEVITVSAMVETDGLPGGLGQSTVRGQDDSLASFSNYGADVDLAAPGVDVLSCWPGGGTEIKSGTSMAAPHVAGAAALYVAKHGKPADAAGVAEVRAALLASGYAQAGVDGFFGDRDPLAEPLVSSRGIDPLELAESRLLVEIATPERFNTYYETSGPLHVFVRDTSYARSRTLGGSAIEARVDGVPASGQFLEVRPGIYRGSLDLVGLPVGEHVVDVTVTDHLGASGAAFGRFVTESFEPAPALLLELATDRLSYSAYFGTAGIVLTALVTDEVGRPIAGLAAEDFAITLIGGQSSESFALHETEVAGSYRAELLLSDLTDGPHRIRVAVADSRGIGADATARYSSADAIVLGGAQVELSADRELYDAFHGQESARLAFEIRGDDGRPFSGIGPLQLDLLVDGVARPPAVFEESAVPGRYSARVDLSVLPHGSHRIVAVYRAAPGRVYFAQADLFRRVLELRW